MNNHIDIIDSAINACGLCIGDLVEDTIHNENDYAIFDYLGFGVILNIDYIDSYDSDYYESKEDILADFYNDNIWCEVFLASTLSKQWMPRSILKKII